MTVAENRFIILEEFIIDCKKFLVEMCLQMKKSFPFEEGCVIALLKNLDPKVALSRCHLRNTSITSLAAATLFHDCQRGRLGYFRR